MNVFEDICSNNSMKVCVHEIKNEIYIAVVFSTNDVLKPNNVLVTGKLLQEDNFSESTLCVRRILKCVEIFF